MTPVTSLCRAHRDGLSVIDDIYARADAEALMPMQTLPAERVLGVEVGGCPHTAIGKDASIDLPAIDEPRAGLPDLDIVVIEPGGDHLAATFSRELADVSLYVI